MVPEWPRESLSLPRVPQAVRHGSVVLVLAVSLVVASCSMLGIKPVATAPATPPPQAMSLSVSNETDLAVSLVVNGQVVRVVNPHSGVGPIPEAGLPPAPWSVEARTASGRALTSMTVREQDLAHTTLPGGAVEHAIPMARIDLTCGRLTVWAGDSPPSGPIWVKGQGAACVP